MPLRDLLTEAGKRARGLSDQLNTTWLARINDLRELSRSNRRKNNYPTLHALSNSVQRTIQVGEEIDDLAKALDEQLTEIRERVQRERFNRS
jgi:hypothetical protein